MKLSEKEIKQLAEELDCGLEIHINLDDNTIKALPNDDDLENYDDDNLWANDIAEIEAWENSIKLEPLESWVSYKFMEDFIETLSDHQMQAKLEIALGKRRPFAHFKAIVENSEYRQLWFEYHNERYLQAIIKNLPNELLPEIE
jgi:hypothetical protein